MKARLLLFGIFLSLFVSASQAQDASPTDGLETAPPAASDSIPTLSLSEMFEDPDWVWYLAACVDLYLVQADTVLSEDAYESPCAFFGSPEVQAITPGEMWVWLDENFPMDSANLAVTFDHWRSRAAIPAIDPAANEQAVDSSAGVTTALGRTLDWPNRDPLGELGGANLYGFIHNNPINRFDPFGLKGYKVGTADPTITPDVGAGAWDSEEWTWSNLALKRLIVANTGIVWIGMPDAVNHVQHYFGNSGSDYTIRLQNMIDDVPSAQRVFDDELGMAQNFVESLPDGKHAITSGGASGGYNGKSESKNWYYAVGGYSAWGKGNATVCKDEYTLEFQYEFYDRYNWDTGKSVTILGQTVTDQFMGDFHRQGLAREFDMRGSVKKTVKWKKGQAPKVTEGWESEQGR